mgnify:FL=1
MGKVFERFVSAGEALGCVTLSLVMVAASGCRAAAPKVIKASVSAEDQQAAEGSISQRGSDEYAKLFSEQHVPRSSCHFRQSLIGNLGTRSATHFSSLMNA